MSEARSLASEDLAKEVVRRSSLTSAEVTEEIWTEIDAYKREHIEKEDRSEGRGNHGSTRHRIPWRTLPT